MAPDKNSLIFSVTKRVAQGVFSMLYRIKIEREASLFLRGPAVILPKHQYWTDIPLVSLSFDGPLCFVAKRELFCWPGVRSFLSLLGGVPIDREQSVRTYSSLKYLFNQLRADGKVVIFPEGTYVRNRVGAGKSRLVEMILRFQSQLKESIPFIPMGIRYGERAGWRRQVEVRVGAPLYGEGESATLSLMQRVMEEISRLSGLPIGDCSCLPDRQGL